MKFQIQTAAIILLTITGVFAAPRPQDAPEGPEDPETPEAPAASSTSVAVASATATVSASSTVAAAATSTADASVAATSAASATAAAAPAVSTNRPYAVFERINFDPALTKLNSGSTARVTRRNSPSFEAASANLFYVSSSITTGTCILDFKFRSSLGSTVSGTGQSQIFTCNPVYNSAGYITKCTRDQFIGTIQARLDGTTTFIPGQGRASGAYPCSYFAGRTVGIDMAAAGDVDAIYWKVGAGDGPYIRVVN